MGSPIVPLDLTLKGRSQGHSDFDALYRGVYLGHILLLNSNRKPYTVRSPSILRPPWGQENVVLYCRWS